MANDKSVFKVLACTCGYKKRDITGKAAGRCKNCGSEMKLSESWYARITHQGRTKVKAISPRRRDAEDYIATCKVAKRAGTLLPGEEKDIHWKDAAKNAEKWWKEAVLKDEIRQSTADFYGFNMVALSKYFGRFTLLMIRKRDVLDYQTARVKEKISNNTINHELTTLRRLYSLHLDGTSIEESPKLFSKHQDLSRVKKLEVTQEKVRFLTAQEAKALLDISTPTVRLAVLIGLNTGLRRANVTGLAWKDIDLKKRLITLAGTAMKNRAPHVVDIPQGLHDELKAWRKKNELTSTYVFPQVEDENAAIDFLRDDFEKAVAAAGLQDVTFHTLRHTFASQWLMNGGDLVTLSEILAHSSIQITKDLYGHLSREHKRKAHDEFANSFLSQLS